MDVVLAMGFLILFVMMAYLVWGFVSFKREAGQDGVGSKVDETLQKIVSEVGHVTSMVNQMRRGDTGKPLADSAEDAPAMAARLDAIEDQLRRLSESVQKASHTCRTILDQVQGLAGERPAAPKPRRPEMPTQIMSPFSAGAYADTQVPPSEGVDAILRESEAMRREVVELWMKRNRSNPEEQQLRSLLNDLSRRWNLSPIAPRRGEPLRSGEMVAEFVSDKPGEPGRVFGLKKIGWRCGATVAEPAEVVAISPAKANE